MNEEPKISEHGFEYYDALPAGWRVSMDPESDFLKDGKRKIGMKFLVMGEYWKVYQVYEVTDRLTKERLKEFMIDNRVFVKSVI